jgi:hypothetical protein
LSRELFPGGFLGSGGKGAARIEANKMAGGKRIVEVKGEWERLRGERRYAGRGFD